MLPRVGLSSIEAPSIPGQRGREAGGGEIHDGRRPQRPYPPVPAQNAPHLLRIGQWSDGNLDDEIEDSVTRAICFSNLAQCGRETLPCLEVLHDWIRQREPHLWLGPRFG